MQRRIRSRISVVNNGAGDSDSDPNIIVDPVGLAVPDGGVAPPVIPGGSGDPTQPIPTLSEWGEDHAYAANRSDHFDTARAASQGCRRILSLL